MKIAIINGPNLNMLGQREQEHYSNITYDQMIEEIDIYATSLNIEYIEYYQSNHEGQIIDYIHQLVKDSFDALIINPGAYSHYSIAILDALLIFKGLKVEVHLSDVLNREEFRAKLITAKACDYLISNKGVKGYLEGLKIIHNNAKL
ncbi:type II 3-dehydroquinate dehydratase [Mycoplasma sp. P36-A1]|uniref:type II 3-dehydroquinate dehydratase n=1 Tax=Mycoplasma sp. P36-A1 TaxID=3252900 RepID=UPI003C2B9599